jgi:hypothetical protein
VLIGTWRTTRENSTNTRVEWNALGQVIRKARERLPYPKGQAGSAPLQCIGRSSGRAVCKAFQTRIVCQLTLAKLTPSQEQVPQDEEHEGCYNEFVRGLGCRLPVNYGCGGSLSSYDVSI